MPHSYKRPMAGVSPAEIVPDVAAAIGASLSNATDRRQDDRRVAQRAFKGPDRRKGERRSGEDRRSCERHTMDDWGDIDAS